MGRSGSGAQGLMIVLVSSFAVIVILSVDDGTGMWKIVGKTVPCH